jgi:hypothetical protein
MKYKRGVLTVREVLEALFATGLVGLGEHDDNSSRIAGRFLSKHAVELRGRSVLGALGSNVATRAECDRRCIDVVVEAIGDIQLDTIVRKGLDITVAIAISDVLTSQA